MKPIMSMQSVAEPSLLGLPLLPAKQYTGCFFFTGTPPKSSKYKVDLG